MMDDQGKSDRLVVPKKRPNEGAVTTTFANGAAYAGTKAETPDTDKAAPAGDMSMFSATEEAVEGRSLVKGNGAQQNAHRTLSRGSAPSALGRVRERARADKVVRFTTLLHHVDVDKLRTAFFSIKRTAAAGVDGQTWADYAEKLEENLGQLHLRVQRGAYRARPSRRVFIPKADGKFRPLGVASLEDKIVQRAIVDVMNAIYEVDFLGFSYGFRPKRSQHDALDALFVGLNQKVGWVLDADIRGFFDAIDHKWLVRFVEHRIADKRVLRLIQKWLSAGVMEEGRLTATTEGTPQGATISPLLANIYLHYVLDLWAESWRRRRARGQMIIVRYADDFIVGFQHRDDAIRFRHELAERLRRFALELHPDKTRLIEFGRYAVRDRAARGQGRPETFDFLGFTHIASRTSSGKFLVRRHTTKKRLRAKLREIGEQVRRRRHQPVPEQGIWLAAVVRGYLAYHAVPFNSKILEGFRREVVRHWFRALRRRSQRHRLNWTRMNVLVSRYIPRIRITHPWPFKRFARRHPRQEPGALAALAGICAGGGP
jgi:group II intron reverse transcriptase/maturase